MYQIIKDQEVIATSDNITYIDKHPEYNWFVPVREVEAKGISTSIGTFAINGNELLDHNGKPLEQVVVVPIDSGTLFDERKAKHDDFEDALIEIAEIIFAIDEYQIIDDIQPSAHTMQIIDDIQPSAHTMQVIEKTQSVSETIQVQLLESLAKMSGHFGMVNIFVRHIRAGHMKLEQVPKRWHDEVEASLKEKQLERSISV